MNVTNFHDFSKTFAILFFSSTFSGLEITILKFHDFSRFFHDRTNPVYSCMLFFFYLYQYDGLPLKKHYIVCKQWLALVEYEYIKEYKYKSCKIN